MSDDRTPSTAWDKYVSAKKAAFGETAASSSETLTLDELEDQIARSAADAGLPEIGMPPRAEVHPVKRTQISKWFYLTLVVLFTALVGFLFWWGLQQETTV